MSAEIFVESQSFCGSSSELYYISGLRLWDCSFSKDMSNYSIFEKRNTLMKTDFHQQVTESAQSLRVSFPCDHIVILQFSAKQAEHLMLLIHLPMPTLMAALEIKYKRISHYTTVFSDFMEDKVHQTIWLVWKGRIRERIILQIF